MRRSIQIYLPPSEHAAYKALLEQLAGAVLTDAEAGQRGAKLSRLIQVVADAYRIDPARTLRDMRSIRKTARQSKTNGAEQREKPRQPDADSTAL